jgi:hypothetical protein
MTEPMRVIPLEYESAQAAASARWRAACQWLMGAAWACGVAAWVILVVVDVESVLITGPILLILGVVTLVLGARLGNAWPMCIGALHCAVCMLFFVLVQLFHWGPGEARLPFAYLGICYCLAVTPLTAMAIIRCGRQRIDN